MRHIAEFDLRRLGGRDDTSHAGKLLRPFRIDRKDSGMRVRTSEDLSIKQPWYLEVPEKLCISGGLIAAIHPLNRLAYEAKLFHALPTRS